MKLVSMERPRPADIKSEMKEAMPTVAGDSYYEKYPWGLRITLNNEELEKLGIDVSDFEIETSINITAKALITSVSSEQNMNEGGKANTRDRLEFQITDLSIDNAEDFGEAFKEAVDE
jgi:hypothetical protein